MMNKGLLKKMVLAGGAAVVGSIVVLIADKYGRNTDVENDEYEDTINPDEIIDGEFEEK